VPAHFCVCLQTSSSCAFSVCVPTNYKLAVSAHFCLCLQTSSICAFLCAPTNYKPAVPAHFLGMCGCRGWRACATFYWCWAIRFLWLHRGLKKGMRLHTYAQGLGRLKKVVSATINMHMTRIGQDRTWEFCLRIHTIYGIHTIHIRTYRIPYKTVKIPGNLL